MRYWFERLRPRVTVPLAMLIALAAGGKGPFDASRWAVDSLCALLLIAQFRLWDDLADREADRIAHPDRVLARSERNGPFVTACLALALANLAIAAVRGWPGTVTLLALNVAAASFYAWRPEHRTVVSDLALSSKYPAFVCVLAAETASLPYVTLAAGLIYVLVCAFEIWDDETAPLRFINS
jgi:4-hydroxybenzoate polyprenyltransferase